MVFLCFCFDFAGFCTGFAVALLWFCFGLLLFSFGFAWACPAFASASIVFALGLLGVGACFFRFACFCLVLFGFAGLCLV